MKQKWLCIFISLMMASALTACDSGGSSESAVIHPGGGNENNGNNGDNGGDETPERCSSAPYANALKALKNRDASQASADELIDYSQCILSLKAEGVKHAVSVIYNGLGDTFSWDPGRDSQVFEPYSLDTNFSVLQATYRPDANAAPAQKYSLAMAGEKNGHRYMALSRNPTYSSSDDATLQWLTNIATWLTETNTTRRGTQHLAGKKDDKFHVIIAQTTDTKHYDGLKNWLDKAYPGAYTLNDMNACDFENLEHCLSSQPADLVIIFGTQDPTNSYARIRPGMDIIINKKIPLLTMNAYDQVESVIAGIYTYMGIKATKNYYTGYQAIDYPIKNLLEIEYPSKTSVKNLLTNLKKGIFDTSSLEPVGDMVCIGNIITCPLSALQENFSNAAFFYRDYLTALDQINLDALSMPTRYPLLAAGLLLADKYRQQIDYPVGLDDETAKFQEALFADLVVSYSRKDNVTQPDLGEYAVKASEVKKGNLANYVGDTGTTAQTRTISIPYPRQWTASGWYLPAGRTATFSSTSDSSSVNIQLGYGYPDVYKSAKDRKLAAPSDVSLRGSRRLPLMPGESITISSPYGAPVYIDFTDPTLTNATITASGVTPYAALLNFNDDASIAEFENQVAKHAYPHVTVASTGLEIHTTSFNFDEAMKTDSGTLTTHQLVQQLKDYYSINYSLGGFKLKDVPLSESLPVDELAVCSSLFGADDCTNEKLHTRETIQHEIYDQRSRCKDASMCSGNPIDASGPIHAYNWGESHELGHNLQTNQLNVQYVDEGSKENWKGYSSRAGENSNNIFPYHMHWVRAVRDPSLGKNNDHGLPLEVYAVAMSELRGLKDNEGNPVIYDRSCNAYETDNVTATRYTAPWQNNSYAIYNGFREAFYVQMFLQADKQVMRSGDKLENGFNIFTLLYQHSRIYNKYAANEADWDSHKSQLGFDLFAYSGDDTYGGGNVREIPGNDFMLVSLSYITNADWRPYFDMFGLHYTTLASKQVDKNGFSRTIKQEVFANKNGNFDIPGSALSADPDLVRVDMTDPKAQFPGITWSCSK